MRRIWYGLILIERRLFGTVAQCHRCGWRQSGLGWNAALRIAGQHTCVPIGGR